MDNSEIKIQGSEQQLQNENLQEEEKINAPLQLSREEKWDLDQKRRWEAAGTFKMTSEESKYAPNSFSSEYDKLDLSGLANVMMNDQKSRSPVFDAMLTSLFWLTELSRTGGEMEMKNGSSMSTDYFAALQAAKDAVRLYIHSRGRGWVFTKNGKKRLDLARRAERLLDGLSQHVNSRLKELNDKDQRFIDYQLKGLSEEEIQKEEELYRMNEKAMDVEKVISTGNFGPELPEAVQQALQKDWLAGNHTETLKSLLGVSDKILSKEEQNTFLAKLMDLNNRLMANKMTVSLLVDADPTAMNMPWLANDIKQFVSRQLTEKDYTSLEPQAIAEVTRKAIKDYQKQYQKELAQHSVRRDRLVKMLGVDSHEDVKNILKELYEFPEMEKLLVEADDETFDQQCQAFEQKLQADDKVIEDFLKTKYSAGTRKAILTKMSGLILGLRLFGTTEQIMTQVETMSGMLQYTAPEEYKLERDLDAYMKSVGIPLTEKDEFYKEYTIILKTYGAKDHKSALKLMASDHKRRAKWYQENILEKFRDNHVTLPAEVWEKLDKLRDQAFTFRGEKAGDVTFQFEINQLVNNARKSDAEKVSHEEYLTKRKFDEEENSHEVIRRAKKEQKKCEELKRSLGEKFVLMIAMEGEETAEEKKLKDSDAVFFGTGKKILSQQDQDEQQKMVSARESVFMTMLERNGVPKDKWGDLLKKFKWVFEGILETDETLHQDQIWKNTRMNLERYGVADIYEAFLKIEDCLTDIVKGTVPKEAADAKEQFESSLKTIEEYDGGKYKDVAEILADIPEIHSAMMSKDPDTLKSLLENKVDRRFAPVMAGKERFLKSSWHAAPIFRRFLHTFRNDIWERVIKGDEEFFENRMKTYSEKLYAVRINANLHAAEEAMKEVFKNVLHKNNKKYKKPTAAEKSIIDTFYMNMRTQSESEEAFEVLMDRQKLVEKAKTLASDEGLIVLNRQADFEFKMDLKRQKKFDIEKDPAIEAGRKIAAKKSGALKGKRQFLDLDLKAIEEVRRRKSLIHVKENGDKMETTVKKSYYNKVRAALQEQLDFVLPNVLKDALIEENATQDLVNILGNIHHDRSNPLFGKLYREAYVMNGIYNLLTRGTREEEPMSPDEAQMYILRLFKGPHQRDYFEITSSTSYKAILKTDDFRIFRENYKKLKAMENEDVKDPSLDQERLDMARNLRLLLITHVGMNDKDEKGKKRKWKDLKTEEERNAFEQKVGTAIERHHAYLKHMMQMEKLIRTTIEDYRKEIHQEISPLYVDSEVHAMREYFMEESLEELKNKTAFDEEKWKEKIRSFYENKNNRKTLLFEKGSVTNEEYEALQNRNLTNTVTEKLLEDVIRKSGTFFHGRENRYMALDSDQKKFFALGLMLMDKGAIGEGTDGTTAILQAAGKKKADMAEIEKQIKNYIEGRSYRLNIDYKECYYKLVNYRTLDLFDPATLIGGTVPLSKTAFEKAMIFAKEIQKRKDQVDGREKDMERMEDGVSSIEAASIEAGKMAQRNEMDKLEGVELKPEDVLNRLIASAKKDKGSKWKWITGSILVGIGGVLSLGTYFWHSKKETEAEDEAEANHQTREKGKKGFLRSAAWWGSKILGAVGIGIAAGGAKLANDSSGPYYKMSKIIKRLEAIQKSPEKLSLFMRVMQNRTLLDKSTANGSQFVRQKERDALFEALSGNAKVASETMAGYTDAKSCRQALINMLSFQLRDDTYFKGKSITGHHFKGGALNRKTTFDWDLCERAFEFMDQIEERRAHAYVARHSKDLIRQAPNSKAVKELDKLEAGYKDKKETYGQDQFEDQIWKSIVDEKPGEDVKRAWHGYMALTNQEKNLFFKVLQNRDLLDISKKGYIKSFFGFSDREYLNNSGRNALIDEYIASSKRGGIGVQLDQDACYEAMRTLLSTQVSDAMDFRSFRDSVNDPVFRDKTNIGGKFTGIFSWERLLFFQRKTAVDWKLFKRALNFVNRASNELKHQEGNELLYQGTGDLVQNGRMVVDYSFLRRNFHKTGNQWTRYIGRRIGSAVNEKFDLDGILGTVIDAVDGIRDFVTDSIGAASFEKDGVVIKGVDWIVQKARMLREYSSNMKVQHTFTRLDTRNDAEEAEHNQTEEQKAEAKKQNEKNEKSRRMEIETFGRLKEGYERILATKSSIAASTKAMQNLLNNELNLFYTQKLQELEAKHDDDNLVNKKVGNKKWDGKHGDWRDTFNRYKEKIKEVYEKVDQYTDPIPFVNDLKKQLIYYANKKAFETAVPFFQEKVYKNVTGMDMGWRTDDSLYKDEHNKQVDFSSEDAKYQIQINLKRKMGKNFSFEPIDPYLDENKNKLDLNTEEGKKKWEENVEKIGMTPFLDPEGKPFDLNTKEGREQFEMKTATLEEYFEYTEGEDGDEQQINKMKDLCEKYTQDILMGVAESVFGKESIEKLVSLEEIVYQNREVINDTFKYVNKGITLVTNSVRHVKGIMNSIGNLQDHKAEKEYAKTKEADDEEKLKKAEESGRLDKKQTEKAREIVGMHKGLGGMASTIAEAMQKYNIASEAINMTIETMNVVGTKLPNGLELVSIGIQEALEFIMFACKVCTDRKALQDYFFTTEDGLKTVNKIQGGYEKMYSKGIDYLPLKQEGWHMLDALKKDYSAGNQVKNLNALDVISDAKGYEHTSELVEDVGMSMAQSIVFCASNFNEMSSTKIMAMSVMGMMGIPPKEIGRTDRATVQKLFNAFKMAR